MRPQKPYAGEHSMEIPDMPNRSSHRQTVPVEGEMDAPPPPYEYSFSPTATSATPAIMPATAPTTSSSTALPTPPSPVSSVSDAGEDDVLLRRTNPASLRSPPVQTNASLGSNSLRSSTARKSDDQGPSSGGHEDVNRTGYISQERMSWEDPAKWEEMEYQAGCCCSESGGCLGSSHGGCCFSDHGGCCFSDYGGCCFSDHGGCCFSSWGGCCCSDTEGSCCCGTDGGSFCSDGPKRRREGESHGPSGRSGRGRGQGCGRGRGGTGNYGGHQSQPGRNGGGEGLFGARQGEGGLFGSTRGDGAGGPFRGLKEQVDNVSGVLQTSIAAATAATREAYLATEGSINSLTSRGNDRRQQGLSEGRRCR